ncbi:MAG: membrane dipeptidase [Burkholderiales bacterium]|nr:MAG: membrane dipeptidase [Burkholderiales bacterium]
MKRSNALLGRTALFALSLAIFSWPASAQTPAQIHREALVIDAHVDVISPSKAKSGGTIDAGTPIDVAKLKKGQVDAIFPSVFVEQSVRTPEGYAAATKEADAKLAAILDIAAKHPNDIVIARSAGDVEKAAAAGKTAIIISFLNAYSLGKDPTALKAYYDKGVRVFGLVHAGNNDFADSSRPHARDKVRENGGLSAAGKQAIALANDLGILVDVSQLSADGFNQALAASRAPVIASHSGISGVVKSARNLTDRELDAIKANNGVVGIVAFSSYLKQQTPEVEAAVKAVRQEYGAVNGYEGLTQAQRDALGKETAALQVRASVDDLAASIDYTVKRIGIDHVAISSDFNHGGGVIGFEDEGDAPNVTKALIAKGYSQADINKLWGGNVLRVLRAAEAVRKSELAQN